MRFNSLVISEFLFFIFFYNCFILDLNNFSMIIKFFYDRNQMMLEKHLPKEKNTWPPVMVNLYARK